MYFITSDSYIHLKNVNMLNYKCIFHIFIFVLLQSALSNKWTPLFVTGAQGDNSHWWQWIRTTGRHWFHSLSTAGWRLINTPLIVDESFVLLKRKQQSIETISSEGEQVIASIPTCSASTVQVLCWFQRWRSPCIMCLWRQCHPTRLSNFRRTIAQS